MRGPGAKPEHPDEVGTAAREEPETPPREEPETSSPDETDSRVDLARFGWLAIVCICLVTILILVLQGYFGYAGVTLAVGLAAAINLT